MCRLGRQGVWVTYTFKKRKKEAVIWNHMDRTEWDYVKQHKSEEIQILDDFIHMCNIENKENDKTKSRQILEIWL